MLIIFFYPYYTHCLKFQNNKMDLCCALFQGEQFNGLPSSKCTEFFPVRWMEREAAFLPAFLLVKV